jgi:uncharacterized protein YceH (UPF0502 family)
MESQPATATAAAPSEWSALDAHERRILGVLIEKAQTTQGGSPLSVNAMVTGSNQKSNRDPVMTLTETEVEDALASAQKKGLVARIIGGRVEHWKHTLYDAWQVSKVELAVLGEVLLRGPQTEGELRGRASRMEPIADVDALREILRPLAERRLVAYLTPEGRRGTIVSHGFHAPEELERLRARYSAEAIAVEAEPIAAPPTSVAPSGPDLREELASLRTQVVEVQTQIAHLAEEIRLLKETLGR